jgi:hypothetical protein
MPGSGGGPGLADCPDKITRDHVRVIGTADVSAPSSKWARSGMARARASMSATQAGLSEAPAGRSACWAVQTSCHARQQSNTDQQISFRNR